jgi:uncharacterized protein YkwD
MRKIEFKIALVTILLHVTTLSFAQGPILKTGQFYCYDTSTHLITNCDNTIGQDGNYQKGVDRNYDKFNINGVRTIVVDNATGLTWDDNAYNHNLNYSDAVAHCEANSARVPTIYELLSITNRSRYDTAFDPIFENGVSDYHWSSTQVLLEHIQIQSEWGNTVRGFDTTDNVKCVSGPTFKATGFVRNDALNVVYDKTHNLSWQDDASVQSVEKNWAGAIAYCEALNFAGKNDWRLPNFNELLSIVAFKNYPATYTGFTPLSNATHFHWTSTTDHDNAIKAWSFAFAQNGFVYAAQKNKAEESDNYVRCVRDGKTNAINPPIIMYLLSSDEGTSTCNKPSITNDASYQDVHPSADIAWNGGYTPTVAQIAAAFNSGRASDATISATLDIPSQSQWDAMNDNEKALYLLNRERYDRGLKPFEGYHSDVIGVAQQYAQTLYDNGYFNHDFGGTDPWSRLDGVAAIRDNHDFFQYGENLHANASSGLYHTEPVAIAIYQWIYADAGSNWGHRDFCLAKGLVENSGANDKEGVIGFGVTTGTNYGYFGNGWYSTIVVMNAFDPNSGWNHAQTKSVSLCADEL